MSSGITPLSPAQETQQKLQASKEGYGTRVLIGFDQFVNVVCNGHPDETVSSRAARAATEGKLWGKGMSKFLDLFQSNHGAKAEAGDVVRAVTVEGLEDSAGDLPCK
jgi:hypothetical protein